jgi:hypothetical protein
VRVREVPLLATDAEEKVGAVVSIVAFKVRESFDPPPRVERATSDFTPLERLPVVQEKRPVV